MSHGKQHKAMSANLVIPVAILIDDDPWSGVVPDFDGCLTQGDTIEETLQNAVLSIEGWLEGMHELGRHIPDLSGLDYWRTHEDYVDGNWIWAVVVVPRPDWWPHATNI